MGAHTYSDLFHLNIHIEYIHIVLGIYISEHYPNRVDRQD